MTGNWLRNAIVYQIFPERFHIANGRSVQDKRRLGFYSRQGDTISSWDALPEPGPGQNQQFFGGDIAGIREKLTYLQDLGVDVVYLTPFYASPSNHRYDTIDYYTIDPASGDAGDFSRLVQAIHSLGMRLIIDIALNHISNRHPYFQHAINDPDSRYREYFRFLEYPDRYVGWYGYAAMPELNFDNPAVINEFITGEQSVLRFWLDQGVDGFRLDTANDLGLPVMQLIEKTVKAANPAAVIVGEVSQYPGQWAAVMDGVQTYYYRNAVLSFIRGEIDTAGLGAVLRDIVDRLPLEQQLGLFNQLGSHDAARLRTTLADYSRLIPFYIAMMFAFPGIPMIYYGEENGMQGGADPANRAPMDWNASHWQQDVRSLFTTWIRLRRERRELREGRTCLLNDRIADGCIAFLRSTDHPDEYSITVLNPGSRRVKQKLFVPATYMHSQLMLEDAFSGSRIEAMAGAVCVELQPYQTMILLPDVHTKPDYCFSKPWHAELGVSS